ncbi:MAG: DUF4145 domain-containing protein [Akkermansia sp.]|nr:DUF4145 domain-containing protein [Akkermansia sp.]
MCEEIKEGIGGCRIPFDASIGTNILLSAFSMENDRLLFCNKCARETSHKVVRYIEPVSELELLKLKNSSLDFKNADSAIHRHNFIIGRNNQKQFLIFNICRVCDSVIIDLCERAAQTSYRLTRVYPQECHSNLPKPNQDMPPECAKTYKEAAEVFPISPRASAGLMRLCLQQFLVELGITGDKLDEQIKILTRAGVPEFVQQYMDVCRVVGNSGVHPTVEMNVDEDPEIAKGLFQAMNIIVQHLITIPREAREAYAKLPKGAIKHIEQRDSKNSKQ